MDDEALEEILSPRCQWCGCDLSIESGVMEFCHCPGALRQVQAEEAGRAAFGQRCLRLMYEEHEKSVRFAREERRSRGRAHP